MAVHMARTRRGRKASVFVCRKIILRMFLTTLSSFGLCRFFTDGQGCCGELITDTYPVVDGRFWPCKMRHLVGPVILVPLPPRRARFTQTIVFNASFRGQSAYTTCYRCCIDERQVLIQCRSKVSLCRRRSTCRKTVLAEPCVRWCSCACEMFRTDSPVLIG